jgi:uncharacterized protein
MSAMAAPLKEKQRIQIIDTVRGVALLGILLMNIPGFSNPEQYENLNTLNWYSGKNYYTWWIVGGFFEGTMRALFSMLFGAGSLLLLNRLEKKEQAGTSKAADVFYRRLIWLFLFGLINAFIFQWWGDILYFYAICGLFLFPFRRMKPRHLLWIALAFFLFSTIKGTYRIYKANELRVKGEQALTLEKQHKILTEDQKEAKDQWVGFQEKAKPESLQKDANKKIKEMHGNYFSSLDSIVGQIVLMESVYFYQFIFFDIMCLLFLGMALFKWGVLTGQRSRRFYWTLLLASYGVGLALSYWEHALIIKYHYDQTRFFRGGMPVDLYEFRRTFLALGHLSVLMLLHKYGAFKWLMQALARVGQMAFTNYLMQSLICVVIFNGFGFGLYGKLQMYQEYYVVFCVWLFQIAFSNIWLHYYRFGPFEWLWRSLTYWKKQPMKRAAHIDNEEQADEEVVPVVA